MTLQRERPKFLAAFLGAATLAAWSTPASAETVRVRNIQVSETAGNTAVVIAASARPTFTTWKLEQPARVVVELSGARLGNVDVPLDAGTYAVGLVSASVTEDDSAGPRTRIVLTLRQASDYQVEAKGNDITLRVVPRARPPVATHETAEARLQIEARAKIEALAKTEAQAQAKAEALAKTEAQAQAKAEALAKTEAQAQAKAEAQAKTEAQAQAKAEALAKTEAQAQAKAEAQAKTEAQAQAKAEAQAKTEAQAQAKAEAQAKTEAQAQAKAEAKAKTEAQAQAKAEAKERALAQSRADAQAKLAAQAQAEIQERALAQRKTESLLKDEAKERLAAQAVAEKHSRAEAAARLEADRLRKELADAHQETAKARAEASAANQESQRRKLALAQAETQVKQAQSEAERARKRADAAENEAIAAHRRETERDKALRVASEEVNARQKTLDRIAQKQEAQQSRLAAAERLVSERETTVRESASRLAEREEAARTARARRDSLARDASKSSKAEAAAALAEAERQHKNAASAAEQSRQELARAVASRRQEEARTEEQANLRRAEENKLDKAVAGRKAEESRLADARAERARLDEEKSKLESERAQLETTRNALLAEVDRLKTTVSATTAALAKPEKTGGDRGNVTAPAARPAQIASTANAQPVAVASPPVANMERLSGFAVPSATATHPASATATHPASATATHPATPSLSSASPSLPPSGTSGPAPSPPSGPATPTAPLLASRAPSQLAALAPSRAASPNLPAMVRSPAGREQSSPASHANRPVPAEPVRTTPATSAPAARPVAVASEPVNAPTSAGRPRSVTLRALSHIRSIDFVDEPNRASVIIDVDNSTIFSIERTAGRRLSLRIEHSELPESLARNLDATEYLGPVKIISSYRDPAARTTVRVDVDLAEDVPNRVRLDGNRIFWDFQKAPAPSLPAVWVPPPSVMFVPARKVAGFFATAKDGLWVGQMAPLPYLAPPVSAPPADTGSSPAAATAPAQPAASAPEGRQGATGPSGRYAAIGKKRYTGRRIDLDFKGADIHNILRLLADVGQVNVIVADDVRGDVTIKMRDVPWDQALDVVLRSKGLGSVREGNLLRVAPLALLEKELEAEIARQKQIADVLPIETRLIGVSYAEAATLLDKIRDLLSPRGKVSQDHRTNTLIVSDVTKNLQLIEDLVRNLDTQTSQVVIEARIVEADTNFARQIGVQWGGTAFADTTHGNPTGLVFPYNVGIGGGADDGSSPLGGLVPGPRTGTGATGNPNFLVNMPAPAGLGTGSAIGLTLGSVAGAFNLNLRLSAMESTGTVRILSSPRVTTMDNIEAHIEQGVSIPVSVVSAMGAQTQFVDAKLSLAVKPHVTNEGTIAMVINVTRNEPDFVNTGARGDPSIQKKEAKTTMLVRDGDTAVIGGIYTRNTGISFSRVPFFSDIPVLGWFFRNRKENDNRSEFLVFITPRIVNRSHGTGQ